MFVDLPLAQLRTYRPTIAEPADFDEFWAAQMRAARALSGTGDAEFRRVASALVSVDVYDVTFPGHGAARIKGWLSVPRAGAADAPVIVEYVGYNGGRGEPLDWLFWPSVGFPHFVMDSRGQGGGWRAGDTPDVGDGGAPSSNGFLTKGIASPEGHYYTRLMVDAARAIDALRDHPAIAGRNVVTTGASQGGGLALAAAHLAGNVAMCLPDVPFLAHFRRAVEVTDAHPYAEIAEYCRVRPREAERVFRVLSYLDAANHAARVRARGLFSVCLRDEIAPPSSVFAAYHRYAGPKDIAVYPFNGHEGGGITHRHAQLAVLAEGARPAAE